MYQVDRYVEIRQAVMKEGISQRKASRRFGVSRQFVTKALACPVPPPYKRSKEKSSKLDPTEADPFARIDNTLSKALMFISLHSETKPLDKECKVDKELLYKVANRFLHHKRQNVRQAGSSLAEGIPEEQFHIIAENLRDALRNDDPTYHSYSQAIKIPGIAILAELNIKEGLDFLMDAFFKGGGGGGKWSFKYKALMKALPHYGANAEPYISKFEEHKNINKEGSRFAPAWQAMVKKIKEDKTTKKLITFD